MDKSSVLFVAISVVIVCALKTFAVPVPALDEADLFEQNNQASFFPGYDRRGAYSGPEMDEMKLMGLLAADDAKTAPSSPAYPDNYSILPPVKRTPPRDVRSRSILCYFNSVSCFGRARQT